VHLQGGEITNNIDDKVRHAVTKLADYHFTTTRLAYRYVIEMGEEPERVFMSGCPSVDLIRRAKIRRQYVKKDDRYIVSIFHPQTEVAHEATEQTEIVMRAVIEFCALHNVRCFWYLPNPDPGRKEMIDYLDYAFHKWPLYLEKGKNLSPLKFIHFLSASRMVIGNSSCGMREAAFLGVPCVNIGQRQGMRERSWNVLDANYSVSDINSAMQYQAEQKSYQRSYIYGAGYAGQRIANHLDKLGELSTKGSLTYPKLPPFIDDHFSSRRFDVHKNNRNHTPARGEILPTKT
jgi:UDP-hydrolysing UDP-N-acetyl-D-glucosamine 2-epimerase